MKNVTILAVIFAVIGIITPAVPASEVVSLRLYGNVFPAPATIPVTITVEPAAKNRMLLVEADGDRSDAGADVPGQRQDQGDEHHDG